jgi:hypothetical protein
MRFVLANLVSSRPTDFLSLEERVPSIYVSSARHIRRLPSPRVIKSHQAYTSDYRRVVYLVRDPRDVAASYLRYLQRIGAQDKSVTLDVFADGFAKGHGTWLSFGSWADHVTGWLLRRGDSDFLLVRYEDLLDNPDQWIARVAAFCGIAADARLISDALAKSSSDKMRDFEKAQPVAVWNSVSKSLNYQEDSLPFVGPAQAGTGRALMRADTLNRFDRALGRVMRGLGYS